MNQQLNIESYEFEKKKPIKGFPELHWTGKRPFKSTQYFPAQLREKYGEDKDGWINKIFWGDNLQVMSHMLKEYRGKIDLIYIDPPFDSKADYKKKIKLKGKAVTNDSTSFEEKQYGDLWTNDEYLQFMFERIVLLKELLTASGCIYLHCDYHKSHYLRIILDEVFGNSNFVNEIIWQKTTSPKAQSLQFSNAHDTIFIYSKSTDFIFNKQYTPYDESYINSFYRYTDEDGRRYRISDFSQNGAGEGKFFGELFISPAPGKHWIWGQNRIDQGMKENRIVISKNGIPGLKRYLDEMPGNPLRDIWNDINGLGPQGSELQDYPTQKPEALLERIIKSSSNEGDLVFDCFMGSGTTQAVAMKLGRRFIGADINLGAIQTTAKRLINVANELKSQEDKYTGFEVYNVNNYDFFRNPLEAKELIISALEIQKFDAGSVYDGELDGRMVKIMPVNRIATKADLEELKANLPYKTFEKRKEENSSVPVERITLVCMGHEPDLKASLEQELSEYKLDIEIVDILRDKAVLQLKREAESNIIIENGKLIIKEFYPMNLLQKLSLQKEYVEDWKQLVESVMIDWNYDGAVMEPKTIDLPDKNEFVSGEYDIPSDAGKIKVKITDLLSESLEVEVG
ncbi:site-specific DNA-methyltransferase (adenine-specific)/adenine-specific DNA-methyltransferase [Hydrogenoanaerobacterium saccharovorans]|uniref:Site-specific DNA-methyltransferase (Adenine-specific)/adenine-specific DNA-methyltransferase n=1 Tax=Hydrogenoanaerobacterium saccharovorans TaxID=474960 RepID=A0A1H7ZZ24_9FIRM|nr:site-specific DNA-methyltransferase [Hydrogenoanaerobacterium saccharovorans]RPF48281.1 site-specific DNA-methyltransferase (adenine-specific)/adenine-specific DNA-methyltransferase [Hydrogenoanaerobacterium saccharovorans]SEM63581.1 site-specific DNA-methyltransferase (adenine-specific)/adenine-specific DNA-methyltransferase [Hydrogenoanaerobacterium saccharovorans]